MRELILGFGLFSVMACTGEKNSNSPENPDPSEPEQPISEPNQPTSEPSEPSEPDDPLVETVEYQELSPVKQLLRISMALALEVHYMLNAGFMPRGQILDKVGIIKDHRIHMVHGRNDTVCLPRAASRLCSALKGAGASDNVTLQFVDAAGHSDGEPRISTALRQATDRMAEESMVK